MPSNLREDGEAFTYRGAVIGMVPALLFLWWFLQRGGMQSWVAFSFLGIYIPMMLVISRLRAQLGPPTHNVQFTTPNLVLPTLVGTRTLGRRTMGMFTMLSPFLMSQRNNPIPLQAEGFRMSSGGRMDRRRLALVLALVAPITIFVYFWASMKVCYQAGLGSTIGYYPYLHVPRRNVVALHEAAQFPSGPDLSVSLAMGVGLVLTLGLMWLKLRFYWWPLHPVAFPIATALESLTPTILVTWLIKAMVLRYGGLRAHRAVLPFFLGLLAGGAMEAVLRRCLSLLLGVDLSYMAT
jgi:hypothetical protein